MPDEAEKILENGWADMVALGRGFMDVMYDVRLAGDCIEPRRINEAVYEGYFAGRFIV